MCVYYEAGAFCRRRGGRESFEWRGERRRHEAIDGGSVRREVGRSILLVGGFNS